jgi:hypothetical protein
MKPRVKSILKYTAVGCGALTAAGVISVAVVIGLSLQEASPTLPPPHTATKAEKPMPTAAVGAGVREAVVAPPAERAATQEPAAPADPTPSQSASPVLPQITASVGLGDTFPRFAEKHGQCTGPAGAPLEVDSDGTVMFAFCANNYYIVSAPRGVVGVLTLQYELTGLLSRTEAEEIALAHAPTDRKKVRAFTNALGNHVTVYRSEALKRSVPEPVWYRGHPVGTFAVYLQPVSSEREYFGAILGTGVDEDENDPGRVE